MDKQKPSLLIQEKTQELETIEVKLNNLLKLSEKVIKKAKRLQYIDFMNRNLDLAKLISSNIDLLQN
jgi:hypothetical protein